MQVFFEGLFPKDNPKNTRFAINFFTSIGLGGLTDNLRDFLKTGKTVAANSDAESDSGSSSDSDSSSSGSSSSESEPDDIEGMFKKMQEEKVRFSCLILIFLKFKKNLNLPYQNDFFFIYHISLFRKEKVLNDQMGSGVEKCHLHVLGHQKTAGENVDRDLILDQNEGPDLDRTHAKGKGPRNKIYLMIFHISQKSFMKTLF